MPGKPRCVGTAPNVPTAEVADTLTALMNWVCNGDVADTKYENRQMERLQIDRNEDIARSHRLLRRVPRPFSIHGLGSTCDLGGTLSLAASAKLLLI